MYRESFAKENCHDIVDCQCSQENVGKISEWFSDSFMYYFFLKGNNTRKCLWMHQDSWNPQTFSFINDSHFPIGCISSPEIVCLWCSLNGSPLAQCYHCQSKIPSHEKAITLKREGIFTIATFYELNIVWRII